MKGEVISLEFRLPAAAEILSVRSIVRYRKGFLHGLEFLGLTDEQRQESDRRVLQPINTFRLNSVREEMVTRRYLRP